jgi:hypothetical protein
MRSPLKLRNFGICSTSTSVLLVAAIMLNVNPQTVMANTPIELYNGESKVGPKEAKDLEFNLKKGDAVTVDASGVDDEPISTFRVQSITNGVALSELSERKTLSASLMIPEDGAYRFHFLNNSAMFEKTFSIRITLTPANPNDTSDRIVKYDLKTEVKPLKKFSTSTGLQFDVAGTPAAVLRFSIDEAEAGAMVLSVGVTETIEPWLRQIAGTPCGEAFAADAVSAVEKRVVLPTTLRGGDTVDWSIFTEGEFAKYRQGLSASAVAVSKGIAAEIKRIDMQPGSFVLFIGNASLKRDRPVFAELACRATQTIKTIRQ